MSGRSRIVCFVRFVFVRVLDSASIKYRDYEIRFCICDICLYYRLCEFEMSFAPVEDHVIANDEPMSMQPAVSQSVSPIPPVRQGAPLVATFCQAKVTATVAAATAGLSIYNIATTEELVNRVDLVALGSAALLLFSAALYFCGTNACSLPICVISWGLLVGYILYSYVL